MPKNRRTEERQGALFLLGIILLVPPILLIFNRPERVLGIPALYLYLFLVWAVLIGLAAALSRRLRDDDGPARETSATAGRSQPRADREPADDA